MMPDLAKVIKGLEQCKKEESVGFYKCDNCPYHESDEFDMWWCERDTMYSDAIALLEARKPEPVSIKDSDGGKTHWYVCGSCKAPINPGDKYCHECGKMVKWDG